MRGGRDGRLRGVRSLTAGRRGLKDAANGNTGKGEGRLNWRLRLQVRFGGKKGAPLPTEWSVGAIVTRITGQGDMMPHPVLTVKV